ncbi:MAG: adenosine deaminase family protein [Pseudomonadota bacterium]
MASQNKITPEFIRRIPKTDLHLHLDGSLRLGTLIDLAKKEKLELPSYEEQGLRDLVFKPRYASLAEYLRGFKYTCAVLREAENIERVSYELAEDNIAEGVRYIEIRLAPQLLMHENLTAEDVVRAVSDGARRARNRHNETDVVKKGKDLPFDFGVIVCGMRAFNSKMGSYYKNLLSVASRAPKKEVFSIASLEMAREAVALRDEQGLPVVGFDLAGEEAGYPSAYHVQAYEYAHKNFLKKTVHAGEAYGPESIFQAITECHANRIGHGTFLFAKEMIQDASIEDKAGYINDLAEYIASRRINMEVCITSNLQTCPQITKPEDHPLSQMLKHYLSISICTDNRLHSNTTVCKELEQVAKHFPITHEQFRSVVIAGFKGSFYGGSYTEKRAYVRQAIDLYDAVAAEMLK